MKHFMLPAALEPRPLLTGGMSMFQFEFGWIFDRQYCPYH